jgi:hypothetical protein
MIKEKSNQKDNEKKRLKVLYKVPDRKPTCL